MELCVGASLEQRIKEHLCRVYGLGQGDVAELYEIGRHTTGETMARLELARRRADAAELAEAAHMLKGTLFNMGLTELGEVARSMELAARDSRLDETSACFSRLERDLAELIGRP